jgi:hypothetical protein
VLPPDPRGQPMTRYIFAIDNDPVCIDERGVEWLGLSAVRGKALRSLARVFANLSFAETANQLAIVARDASSGFEVALKPTSQDAELLLLLEPSPLVRNVRDKLPFLRLMGVPA